MTTTTQKRDIMVTMALPYANGAIHLGHMVEAIQTDIWVRFQKSRGHKCLYICGSDAHGTAIMLSAEKKGITPEELIQQVHADHLSDFTNYSVDYDNFYTTHSPENKELSKIMYQRLHDNGDISTRTITQAYDAQDNIFLADRFIKGECPKCHTKDQYGDNCESCGATYQPMELIDPVSTMSGTTPIEKESEHYFFHLDNYKTFLEQWIQGGHLQPQIANKLQEWFDEGLKQWDISRDAPYFGFEIPNAPGKYFYVWLDAPIGYMASLKNLCTQRNDINFDHYWNKDSKTELYHFIGKDIVYFHALFWPAMLQGAHYRLPNAIFVHGFLTINGTKMSKSRGTYISAKEYSDILPTEYIRYYYAAKLNAQVEDIDLNLEDFMLRVNSDLVGKYVNLASRCAGFITKKFDCMLADTLHDAELFNSFSAESESIAKSFEGLDYNRAVRDIMALADRANQYIDYHKPWSLAKEEGKEQEVQLICTQGLNLFRLLTIYLSPILPQTADKVVNFLNIDSLQWSNAQSPLLHHKINKFKPLMQRITPEQIAALVTVEEHEKAQ